MSRTIQFKMQYPYFYYNPNCKYGYSYSNYQEKVNGSNTYPYVFNSSIPRCVGFRIGLYVQRASGSYVTGRNWYIYVYSGGWTNVGTVYVNESTQVYIDVDFTERTITKVVAVPSDLPSSYSEWTLSMELSNMRYLTALNTIDLTANGYFKGLFGNYYGFDTNSISGMYVNISGVETAAKGIFANVDGTLVEIPPVPSAVLKTTKAEEFAVFEFTPSATGSYRFVIKQGAGDHDGWLYDSSFNLLSASYFDNQAFTLSQGSVYYILLMQYYNNTTPADSILQVIKEG